MVVSSGLPIVLVRRPLPPSRPLGSSSRRPEWMHEDEHAQFLALRPERMESGIGQFLAGHAAAHADAAEAELLHSVLDLLGGELGMLQRGGREGDETVGIGRAEFDQRLVLHLDQLGRRVALGTIPIGIDAERFHVDALRIHRRDAHAGVGHQQARRLERMLDDGHGCGHRTMGVDVDGLDLLAVDHHLAPPRMSMAMPVRLRTRRRCRRALHVAAREGDAAGRRARNQIPAQSHVHLPAVSSIRARAYNGLIAESPQAEPCHRGRLGYDSDSVPESPRHGRP